MSQTTATQDPRTGAFVKYICETLQVDEDGNEVRFEISFGSDYAAKMRAVQELNAWPNTVYTAVIKRTIGYGYKGQPVDVIVAEYGQVEQYG